MNNAVAQSYDAHQRIEGLDLEEPKVLVLLDEEKQSNVRERKQAATLHVGVEIGDGNEPVVAPIGFQSCHQKEEGGQAALGESSQAEIEEKIEAEREGEKQAAENSYSDDNSDVEGLVREMVTLMKRTPFKLAEVKRKLADLLEFAKLTETVWEEAQSSLRRRVKEAEVHARETGNEEICKPRARKEVRNEEGHKQRVSLKNQNHAAHNMTVIWEEEGRPDASTREETNHQEMRETNEMGSSKFESHADRKMAVALEEEIRRKPAETQSWNVTKNEEAHKDRDVSHEEEIRAHIKAVEKYVIHLLTPEERLILEVARAMVSAFREQTSAKTEERVEQTLFALINILQKYGVEPVRRKEKKSSVEQNMVAALEEGIGSEKVELISWKETKNEEAFKERDSVQRNKVVTPEAEMPSEVISDVKSTEKPIAAIEMRALDDKLRVQVRAVEQHAIHFMTPEERVFLEVARAATSPHREQISTEAEVESKEQTLHVLAHILHKYALDPKKRKEEKSYVEQNVFVAPEEELHRTARAAAKRANLPELEKEVRALEEEMQLHLSVISQHAIHVITPQERDMVELARGVMLELRMQTSRELKMKKKVFAEAVLYSLRIIQRKYRLKIKRRSEGTYMTATEEEEQSEVDLLKEEVRFYLSVVEKYATHQVPQEVSNVIEIARLMIASVDSQTSAKAKEGAKDAFEAILSCFKRYLNVGDEWRDERLKGITSITSRGEKSTRL